MEFHFFIRYHDMIAAVNQVLKNPDLSRVARKGVRFESFFDDLIVY
jgi:arylsulfatase A-like enzyme